jgi:NAD+ diphosphatase
LIWRFCPACGCEIGEKVDGGPQVCDHCGTRNYDNPVPVVCAIVETPVGVILAHNRSWPAKMFGPVTGFLEHGEAPSDAVIREVQEELGLKAHIRSFVGVYPFPQMNQIILAYGLSAEGSVKLGSELDDFRAVAPEKLRAWEFGTGRAVADWLDNRQSASSQRPGSRRPLMHLLDLLSRRWALRILWELSRGKGLRFNALQTACGGLSPDTLSSRLKELRQAGLVDSGLGDAAHPGERLWSLASRAEEIEPVMIALSDWAARCLADPGMEQSDG